MQASTTAPTKYQSFLLMRFSCSLRSFNIRFLAEHHVLGTTVEFPSILISPDMVAILQRDDAIFTFVWVVVQRSFF